MRKWVNINEEQFRKDTYYANIEKKSPNASLELDIPLIEHLNYQKDTETYIYALVKREYAQSLSEMIINNTYIYSNNISDILSSSRNFIDIFQDVYNLQPKQDIKNIGSSIKELITCYEEKIKSGLIEEKRFEILKNFLLSIPSKQTGTISISDNYLDQYAKYYANGLRHFLSLLATIFNTDIEQPKQKTGYDIELYNNDKKRFNEWFDKFENEYEFEEPKIQIDFPQNNPHIHIETESFNNIKLHLKDINFENDDAFSTINDLLLNFNCLRTMVFENCNFNYWFYEHSRSLLFKNCIFNAPVYYHAKPQIGYLSIISFLRFEKCTFNDNVTITDMNKGISDKIILKDCRFTENANLNISDATYLNTLFDNVTFEGKVSFENIRFNNTKWSNLFFLNDFRNKNIYLPFDAKLKQIVFGVKMVRISHQSIRNFVKILKDSKLNDYAQELEQFYIPDDSSIKNKEQIDIAIKSDWVGIKLAARILELSYNTLLTMRKEDKATGITRIPYIGEGKSTRYYYPLLIAYKKKDMDLVNKLAKEMDTKQNN